MMRFSFRKGLVFKEVNVRWQLIRRLVTGKLQFENDVGEIKTLIDSEVFQLWSKGDWVIDESTLGSQLDALYLATPRDLSTFPMRWQNRAQKRMHYINWIKPEQNKYNLANWQSLIKAAAKKINDDNPPCPSSVQAWWKKYRETKSILTLIPRSVTGFERAKDPRYCIFEEMLATIYLTPQKRPRSDVVKAVQNRINEINLDRLQENKIPVLSRSVIYKWIAELHQDIIVGISPHRDQLFRCIVTDDYAPL